MSDTAAEPPAGGRPRPTVFINYRHTDAAWALLLDDRLASRFGKENVFLDARSLKPGVQWLTELRDRGSSCTAFIALIGPDWARTMVQRAQGTEEDYARAEIERAFGHRSAVRAVLPVLVGDATQPGEQDLPALKSLWPLLHRQWWVIHPQTLDDDIAKLIKRIEEIAQNEPEQEPDEEDREGEEKGPEDDEEPVEERWAQPPSHHHYAEVGTLIAQEGLVIPVLGPGANSSGRDAPWDDVDCDYLPDADELAAYLAKKVDATAEDLAGAAQHVMVEIGHGVLWRELRKAFTFRGDPSRVHRFLAALPSKLDRYQLIVTTNYDRALEETFDRAEEPYDLAVYMASGPDKGKFVHIPHDGEPEVIQVPNKYQGFPIHGVGNEVSRTVIMKIHGAVDEGRGPYQWKNNYVITEDDYIDFLAFDSVESIVPSQLKNTLDDSNLLFLGYTMSDWNLRVFLKRIYGSHLPNSSWAVQENPGRYDSKFWKEIGADLVDASLDKYLDGLERQLAENAATQRA